MAMMLPLGISKSASCRSSRKPSDELPHPPAPPHCPDVTPALCVIEQFLPPTQY
ncbi:MAG: hypothetical protein WA977_08635 [Halobacteriota archaeon]